jgi:MFS family permease
VPGVAKLIDRVLSDDPLIRAMSYQCVLSAFGQGVFMTGSAVFFTRIVGLSATQVGLGLTIGMAAEFLVSVPLGRLADRVGTRLSWLLGSVLEIAMFVAWFAVSGFWGYVAVTIAIEVVTTWMNAGRNAYRLEVFPRDQRVRSNAYMRAARNVGYTLGALAGGIALAIGDPVVIRAVPLVSAGVLVLNIAFIRRLPEVGRHAAAQDAEDASGGDAAPNARNRRRSALRNHGFLLMSVFDGVLGTHQVLLNVVIPLWLVEDTNAPRVLLAWLFGTNTILAVALQVAAARGVTDIRTALRAEYRAAACFVISCAIILVTDHTVLWLTIPLVWLAHVTVTGAELFNSAGEWGLVSELSDPRRRGEYQGVQNLGYVLGTVWAPAAYTFLATHWHTKGWLLIAAIIVIAAAAIRPATLAAERFLAAETPAREPVLT